MRNILAYIRHKCKDSIFLAENRGRIKSNFTLISIVESIIFSHPPFSSYNSKKNVIFANSEYRKLSV